ncbi:hypothetical protein DBR47_03635 [Paucibacter sp. KBW04]|uniref:glycosyltransferase n=1 Tax=Paucibacter sp. KBW04 TaxID=2153361 RepID=UPI000F577E43|nr:glycosyltransferase [Paucibacter sp. KBW04]RQO62350.1 hypothetical protein DBR47_03635 [Paucibacter sp. KBW04]
MGAETVLFLLSSLTHGGAERHTITLINSVSKDRPVVVAYLRNAAPLIDSIDQSRLKELVCLNASGMLDLAAAMKLAQLFKKHDVRVVVYTNLYPLLYGGAARLFGWKRVKEIEVFHSTLLRSKRESLQMVLYKLLLRGVDRMVYVCENQKKHWLSEGLNHPRSAVIHNGIDLGKFVPIESSESVLTARAKFGFEANDLVIGILAVMRPEKAHGLLLRAVASCAERGANWKVLMIGDGPERANIQAQVASLGLVGKVVFAGLLSDVREAVSAVDAMALVSTAVETFSIGALEAMAMAKPMIMSDIGGASEQVDDGVNGFLFRNGNVEELSYCLEKMAVPGLAGRMGALARSKVESHFSEGVMLTRYQALIADLAASS